MALGAALAAACSSKPADKAGLVTPLALAAAPGSALPNLRTAADGSVLLSWTEPAAAGGAHALRWAELGQRGFGPPATVAVGADWLLNWADFPSVTRLGPRALLAHWLRKRPAAGGKGVAGYDIELARSDDGGATWSAPWRPHRDDTATEHGFVSVVPRGQGGALAIWLDGRAFAGLDEASAEQHAAMALRALLIEPPAKSRSASDSDPGSGSGSGSDPDPDSGSVSGSGSGSGSGSVPVPVPVPVPASGSASPSPPDPSLELDPRTCSCCQTSAVATDDAVLVAYRDRSADEIRDIAVTRFADGRWTAPVPVHADGWHIDGCPVNGPALAASGARVAVAWYTAANDQAQVKLALSEDGGRSFGPPLRIDQGSPQGRVDVALAGELALVSWQELAGPVVELRVRAVELHGARLTARPSHTVTAVAAGRASGFPQLAVQGGDAILAWTAADAGGKTAVAAARIAVSALR